MLKHVSIPLSDQDRAVEFYAKKLGFEVFVDVDFGEQRWIELEISGGETVDCTSHSPGISGLFLPLSPHQKRSKRLV